MNSIWNHPFAETWWTKGVQSAINHMGERDRLYLALDNWELIATAVEDRLEEAGLEDKFLEFLDDLFSQDNGSQLQMELQEAMGHALVEAFLKSVNIADLEAHVATCNKESCRAKKALQLVKQCSPKPVPKTLN